MGVLRQLDTLPAQTVLRQLDTPDRMAFAEYAFVSVIVHVESSARLLHGPVVEFCVCKLLL